MRLNAFLTTLPSPTNMVLKAHGRWFAEEQEIPYREEIVARFRIPEIGRCRLRNVPQKTPFIEREILVKIGWSTRKAKLWAQRTFFSCLSVSKRQPSSMRVQIFDTWLSGSRTTVKLMVLWVHWNQQNDASSVVPNTSCGESKHKKAVKPSHWALFVLVKLVAWDRHCCTSSQKELTIFFRVRFISSIQFFWSVVFALFAKKPEDLQFLNDSHFIFANSLFEPFFAGPRCAWSISVDQILAGAMPTNLSVTFDSLHKTSTVSTDSLF